MPTPTCVLAPKSLAASTQLTALFYQPQAIFMHKGENMRKTKRITLSLLVVGMILLSTVSGYAQSTDSATTIYLPSVVSTGQTPESNRQGRRFDS